MVKANLRKLNLGMRIAKRGVSQLVGASRCLLEDTEKYKYMWTARGDDFAIELLMVAKKSPGLLSR
jgi:hypothetical protein